MTRKKLPIHSGLILFFLFAFFLAPSLMADESLKVVFLAGRPSHGYGSHEHLAGCRVLAEAIENSTENVVCEVYSGGWPEDASVLDDADTIVMYCDGGKRHPALQHFNVLDKHMKRGSGFVCLHYGVEVPPDDGGKEFLRWLGGYFEINWSVNPHWTAEYKSLPKHPITQGVKPFAANDEWYFHMRFQPEMKGVTPILSAIAPEQTMSRKDGAHSGNPAVRKAVANGEPQHTAWAYERENGGRSFGFTVGTIIGTGGDKIFFGSSPTRLSGPPRAMCPPPDSLCLDHPWNRSKKAKMSSNPGDTTRKRLGRSFS